MYDFHSAHYNSRQAAGGKRTPTGWHSTSYPVGSSSSRQSTFRNKSNGCHQRKRQIISNIQKTNGYGQSLSSLRPDGRGPTTHTIPKGWESSSYVSHHVEREEIFNHQHYHSQPTNTCTTMGGSLPIGSAYWNEIIRYVGTRCVDI